MISKIRSRQLRAFLLSSVPILLFPAATVAQAQEPPKSSAEVVKAKDSPKSAADIAKAKDAAKSSGDSDAVEVITVTAQRRAEPLQDVPLSITSITGDQLKNANITNADRLEQLVPGLTMGRSGSELRPAMRGTYTEIVSVNADPRFGIYVDDIYSSRTSQVPPIVDLARVEVQKGPQGTLYGRNSFGGNIVFHSALPTDKFEGGVDVKFGKYSHSRLEGFLNMPISEGVALRIAALAEKSNGYVKNIGTGSDFGGEEQKFIRGTLRITPSSIPALEVLLRASYLDLGGQGLAGFGYKYLGSLVDTSLIRAPGQSLTRNGVTYNFPNGFNGSSLTGVFFPIDTRFRDGIPDVNGADIGVPTLADPYKVNYADKPFRNGSQQQYGATVNYDIGSVRLRSISSFTDFDLTRTAANLLPVLLSYSYQITTSKTLTQELQILSNDDASPFQWIGGGYYFDDNARDRSVTNQNRAYVTATAPAGQQLFPFGFTTLPTGTGFNQTTAFDSFSTQQQKTRSLAAYGQLSYTFAEKLTLTTGLRYTQDKKSFMTTRFNVSPTGPGAYFVHSIDDPVNYQCGGFVAANSTSVSASPTAVAQAYNFVCGDTNINYYSYRLAADYKFDRNHMMYASYSTGTHAGGFNTGIIVNNGVPGLLPAFGPENVKAFEIGSKNSFYNNKLTLNAAIFRNDYTDLQAQTTIPNPIAPLTSVSALVQNIGKDRAIGLDLDAVYRPTKNLSMTLSYNWLDAKIIKYEINTFANGFCGSTPDCVGSTGDSQGVQGTPFPNARTDPNRFVPILDANGNQIVSGGVAQFRYVVAGTGRDGTKYTLRKQFSAKQTIRIGANYDINLGSAGTITPGIQTYYNSGYILTDVTPSIGSNPAYFQTDLKLAYRSADNKFNLQVFVNNVENNAVITRAVNGNNRSLLVNYAPPRTYGISGGFRF